MCNCPSTGTTAPLTALIESIGVGLGLLRASSGIGLQTSALMAVTLAPVLGMLSFGCKFVRRSKYY